MSSTRPMTSTGTRARAGSQSKEVERTPLQRGSKGDILANPPEPKPPLQRGSKVDVLNGDAKPPLQRGSKVDVLANQNTSVKPINELYANAVPTQQSRSNSRSSVSSGLPPIDSTPPVKNGNSSRALSLSSGKRRDRDERFQRGDSSKNLPRVKSSQNVDGSERPKTAIKNAMPDDLAPVKEARGKRTRTANTRATYFKQLQYIRSRQQQKYPLKEVLAWKSLFDYYDKNDSGTIDKKEFMLALKDWRFEIHVKSFEDLDLDKDELLNFREWLYLMYPYASKKQVDFMIEAAYPAKPIKHKKPRVLTREQLAEVQAMFTLYDCDDSASLCIREFTEAMKDTGYDSSELSALFSEHDVDQNHVLDLAEFITLMTKFYLNGEQQDPDHS
eukprot:Colp12_sorted_trinity150504_noHs@30142